MSGSSRVYAYGDCFAVFEKSLRTIFRGSEPGAEREWHEEWKREHQGAIDAIGAKVAKALAAHRKEHALALTAYDEKLPEVWTFARAGEEHSYEWAVREGKPVRYVVRFYERDKAPDSLRDIQLEVAFSRLPEKPALEALLKAVEAPLSSAK